MAQLPPIRRFTKEDFKDIPWIDKLIYPMNLFLSAVTIGFRNNLTVKDNLAAQWNTITVSTKASSVTPSGSYDATLPKYSPLVTSVSYSLNQNIQPLAVMVAKVVDTANVPLLNVYGYGLDWSYNPYQVTINQIGGLQPGRTYNVTLQTWFG